MTMTTLRPQNQSMVTLLRELTAIRVALRTGGTIHTFAKTRFGVTIQRDSRDGKTTATVVLTQLKDNPSVSVTNVFESLAALVYNEGLRGMPPESVSWFEHYQEGITGHPTLQRVELKAFPAANGIIFCNPVWSAFIPLESIEPKRAEPVEATPLGIGVADAPLTYQLQLAKLLCFVSNMATAIRMHSAYNGEIQYDFHKNSQRYFEDLMWLSDSLHDFYGLAHALTSNDHRRIAAEAAGLIRAFEIYQDPGDLVFKSDPRPSFERNAHRVNIDEALTIFRGIRDVANAMAPPTAV